MASVQLIADSGATSCEWCLINQESTTFFRTTGISPYFLDVSGIVTQLQQELIPQLPSISIDELHFYGTGLATKANKQTMQSALEALFPASILHIETDLLAAARALCGHEKGIACILGTGINACVYDGKEIIKNSPGLGYVLGDEGSGAYLGKKVIQHYIYQIFDNELRLRFEQQFKQSKEQILHAVYKAPFANRYLAGYALFISENRGHYMIENLLEDGLNDFFSIHLQSFSERFHYPIHFTGSISHGFKDILASLCDNYSLQLGTVCKSPIEGLVTFHTDNL